MKYIDEFIQEAKDNDFSKCVSFSPSKIAIGRNVIWCPYLNEPVFLSIYEDSLDCPGCAHNYEATNHKFICCIKKP